MGEGKRRDAAGRPDRRRPITERWESFRVLVMHPEAPPGQVREMRRAFFAGAEALLTLQMRDFENTPDAEPTEADMQLMDDIHADIVAFAHEVKAGRA
jgi:hypothetical protein